MQCHNVLLQGPMHGLRFTSTDTEPTKQAIIVTCKGQDPHQTENKQSMHRSSSATPEKPGHSRKIATVISHIGCTPHMKHITAKKNRGGIHVAALPAHPLWAAET